MKSLVFILGLPLLLAACKSKTTAVQDFIAGSYVHTAKGEFSIANDTLVFSRVDELHYRLERRTGFSVVRDGKLLPKRLKVARFETVFDPMRLELSEPRTGRVFRFDRSRGVLLLNQAVYKKL